MKVAMVVPGFSSGPEDWCIPVLTDVVKALAREADVRVFALRYPGPRGEYSVHGVRVLAFGGGSTGRAGRLLLLSRALVSIVAEHRREAFDVVHGVWADEPGAVTAVLGRLLGVPSVVSVMGGELVAFRDMEYGGRLSFANRGLSRLAVTLAGRITAGSDAALERVRELFPRLTEDKLERLTWGVDTSLFPSGCTPAPLAGDFRILAVGSLVPVKDHRTLLEAAAEIRASVPGVHLHLVGDGPERDALAARAAALGLAGAVTFHGNIDREQLCAVYRAAHVLVVSSRHELQPAVALEAALCGLPIVGTQVGLISELAAAVIPVLDAPALAASLARVAGGGIDAPAADNAEKLVRALYLSPHTAARLVALYATMVARSKEGKVTSRVLASGGSRPRTVLRASRPAESVDRHE